MAKFLLVAMSLLLLGGCGATVYPQNKPLNPTAVYVADYGIHSSLLLPDGDGRYVEYAFGDWNFAAMNHTWPQDAVGALLVSFQSALGRRYLTVSPEDPIPHPLRPPPHRIQIVYASQADVERVVKELDARFTREHAKPVHNADNGMDYVKDSEHYSIANNCNHLTARCLREMHCEVKGLVLSSSFAVVSTPPPPAENRIQTAIRAPSPATMPSARTSLGTPDD